MRFFRSAPRTFASPGCLALLIVGLALIPRAATGEYRLQPGDTLDVSLTGLPDFRQQSPIGVEGDISLPLVGQINVSNLSISEARDKIAGELSNKLFRRYTMDGREIPHLILGGEVVVTAIEYSPIYVNGDVAKPDAYKFRPGMTVRQAVAVAGGYDLMRFRAANPLLQAADLQSEYETLWLQFAGDQARAWRLRTELGEQAVEYAGNKAPIPAGMGERLIKTETEQLKVRVADRQNEKARLEEAIKKANLQLSILAEKKSKDEEGSQADSAEFKSVRELFQKGLTPVTRLSEARRAALLSSVQLLQTIIEMSNVERQRDEYVGQLAKVDTQYRIDDLQELQRTNMSLAQTTARLRTAGEKLMQVGLLRSQLVRGPSGRIATTVYRKGGNGPQRLVANEDLELAPGDVVEVAVQDDGAADVATSSSNVHAEAAVGGVITK